MIFKLIFYLSLCMISARFIFLVHFIRFYMMYCKLFLNFSLINYLNKNYAENILNSLQFDLNAIFGYDFRI